MAFLEIVKRYMVSFRHRYNVTQYVKISSALFSGITALLSACYWQVTDELLLCSLLPGKAFFSVVLAQF